MELTDQEKNYKVAERAESDVKEHGSIEKAIAFLKAELASFDALWSKYSSDCLGHGITCTRLKIAYLERLDSKCERSECSHPNCFC